MKILLATDGSKSAKAARDFTVRFPFPEGSEITLLTVVENDNFLQEDAGYFEEDQQAVLREVEKSARQAGEELIKSESAHFRASAFQPATDLRTGHPADEIVKAAGELQVDLVVVGSQGLTGMKHFLLGSVSEKVLNHVPCSVLIVRKDSSDEAKNDHSQSTGIEGKEDFLWNVLLAYDGSEPARKAVALCASFAFHQSATIYGLTVIPLVKIYRQDLQLHMQKIVSRRKLIAEEAIDNAFQEMSWTTPNVGTQLREGSDVGEEILAAAKKLETNLIFIGHKGKSGIKKFFLGSVTENVAKNARCSVWVVRDKSKPRQPE